MNHLHHRYARLSRLARVVSKQSLCVITALLACMVAPESASAQVVCTVNGNSGGDTRIGVPRMAPDGTRLEIDQRHDPRVNCRGLPDGTFLEIGLEFEPGANPIANPYGPGILIQNTNVPGVGVVMTSTNLALENFGQPLVTYTTSAHGWAPFIFNIRAFRVKHGTVDFTRNFPMNFYPFAHLTWRAPGLQDTPVRFHSLRTEGFRNSDTVFPERCWIQTPQRVIELGSYPASSFKGVGTSPQHGTRIDVIGVACTAFNLGDFEINGDADVLPGVIRPKTGPGMASGVGVQMLEPDGVTPWLLGSRREMISDSEWPDVVEFPNQRFAVRIVQTAPSIQPGAVEAILTMTLSYK